MTVNCLTHTHTHRLSLQVGLNPWQETGWSVYLPNTSRLCVFWCFLQETELLDLTLVKDVRTGRSTKTPKVLLLSVSSISCSYGYPFRDFLAAVPPWPLTQWLLLLYRTTDIANIESPALLHFATHISFTFYYSFIMNLDSFGLFLVYCEFYVLFCGRLYLISLCPVIVFNRPM